MLKAILFQIASLTIIGSLILGFPITPIMVAEPQGECPIISGCPNCIQFVGQTTDFLTFAIGPADYDITVKYGRVYLLNEKWELVGYLEGGTPTRRINDVWVWITGDFSANYEVSLRRVACR